MRKFISISDYIDPEFIEVVKTGECTDFHTYPLAFSVRDHGNGICFTQGDEHDTVNLNYEEEASLLKILLVMARFNNLCSVPKIYELKEDQ